MKVSVKGLSTSTICAASYFAVPLQPESYLRYDPIESFSTLVERVREHVLEKTAHLNQKIFTEEINPKGSDYWYAQKLY